MEEIKSSMLERKNKKLDSAMSKPVLDIQELRDLSWTGISTSKPFWDYLISEDDTKARPIIWKVLLGYVPQELAKQKEIINRKR